MLETKVWPTMVNFRNYTYNVVKEETMKALKKQGLDANVYTALQKNNETIVSEPSIWRAVAKHLETNGNKPIVFRMHEGRLIEFYCINAHQKTVFSGKKYDGTVQECDKVWLVEFKMRPH